MPVLVRSLKTSIFSSTCQFPDESNLLESGKCCCRKVVTMWCPLEYPFPLARGMWFTIGGQPLQRQEEEDSFWHSLWLDESWGQSYLSWARSPCSQGIRWSQDYNCNQLIFSEFILYLFLQHVLSLTPSESPNSGLICMVANSNLGIQISRCVRIYENNLTIRYILLRPMLDSLRHEKQLLQWVFQVCLYARLPVCLSNLQYVVS